MTPQEAKDRALQVEQEIVGRLPASAVASVDPSRAGALMTCSMKGAYTRAAGVKIHIVEGQDPGALLPDLARSYQGDERFQVSDITTEVRTDFQLVGGYGEGYVIGTTSGENVLRIDSFSPCFVLPETMSPLGDF